MTLSPLQQMAERLGISLEEMVKTSVPDEQEAPSKPATTVENGPELQRVLALPRRPAPGPTDPNIVSLARLLTEKLARRPDPYPGALLPHQAAALQECWQYGGLFGPLRVGSGKTLLCYLAPVVCGAKRPIYVAPAALEPDVAREFKSYYQSWRGPHPQHYPFVSYQKLGHPNAGVKHDKRGRLIRAGLLERLKPDLIVFDEAHALRNVTTAAVAKRVRRYLQENPQCRVIAVSGTMMNDSLLDFAHILKWCLPRNCPLPTAYAELHAWADALDEKDTLAPRPDVGALIRFCTSEELVALKNARGQWDENERALEIVRGAVGRRIVETPGVVATQDGPLGIPLKISDTGPVREDPKVNEVFRHVRSVWETPDGQPIADGLQLARHCRAMGLGFYQRWTEQPPNEWLKLRKEWASWCREVIKHNRRGIDSEAPVKAAVRSGLFKDYGLLEAWEAIEPSFTPVTEAVWFSNEVFEAVQAWVSRQTVGSIVWVQHIELGQRLERDLGVTYYGEEGRDARGRFILDHAPNTPMVASLQANGTGRNLQRGWSANLWLCSPGEQSLGRTHRKGQTADVVTNDVYLGCVEHIAAFWKKHAKALATQQTQGQSMRLVYAESDVASIDEVESRNGARWRR